MRNTLLALLMGATALGGCASAGRFETPTVALPETYPNAATTAVAAPAATDAWWKQFADPRLDALVDQVLIRNNNLAAATILVRRARLQAGLATNALLPSANGAVNTTSNSDGPNSASTSASISWQADLFGRLGAEQDAARWEARATAEDLAATRLSLIGSTLELYWGLAELNERIGLIETSVAYAERTLSLVSAQRTAGQVSDIELNEARRSVETQRATLESARQSRTETRTALALLLGAAALSAGSELEALPNVLAPAIEPGRPADILARRPDLQAAETRLRSNLSTVDAARASFYPQITLTGTAGGTSGELSSVLNNPATALGVGVTLPFLNFNQLRLQLRVTQADYERNVSLFRQTLLQAFSDVDNALSSNRQLALEGEHLQAALRSSRAAESLYRVRYDSGAEALRVVLDAEEQRRSAERSELTNRLNRLRAQSTLFQALGGG